MNIFFDLDGTLINSKLRLFNLFNSLVTDSVYTFEEYWEIKQNKFSHQEILVNHFGYTENQFKVFQEKWMCEIEKKEWLNLDVPFDGVTQYLTNMMKYADLYIVTARQSKERVSEQLNLFGWKEIFKKVLVTSQVTSKAELIHLNVKINKNDWIVGDTGNDIMTGKKLGISTAAVLSGFINKSCLLKYQPDLILENVINFKL
jgi:phosphoglycolate phosphatase